MKNKYISNDKYKYIKFNLIMPSKLYERVNNDVQIDISYKSTKDFINKFIQELIYHELYILSDEDREKCFTRAKERCGMSDDNAVEHINLLRLAINNPDFDKQYYAYLFGSPYKKSYIKDDHYVKHFTDKSVSIYTYRPPRYLGIIMLILIDEFDYKWTDISKLLITKIDEYLDRDDLKYL